MFTSNEEDRTDSLTASSDGSARETAGERTSSLALVGPDVEDRVAVGRDTSSGADHCLVLFSNASCSKRRPPLDDLCA